MVGLEAIYLINDDDDGYFGTYYGRYGRTPLKRYGYILRAARASGACVAPPPARSRRQHYMLVGG
jgi:hypothetical protein